MSPEAEAAQPEQAASAAAEPAIQSDDPAPASPSTSDLKLKRLVPNDDVPVGPQAPEDGPPRAFVFNSSRLKDTIGWLAHNWFYALAAVSLALAGIFMIQYSVEAGLLSPPLRVLGALVMGGALIFVAEYLRRRGSDTSGDLAFLPSTFAVGGFITLFAAVWGAYTLYGLIGPLLAFGLMAIVGISAILCGWMYGPLLSAIGTTGAIATPFLLGGESDNTHLLMPYFAAVGAGALVIDSARRWAWLSVLAVVLSMGASTLVRQITDADHVYFATMIGIAVLATAIPIRRLWPDHVGPAVLPSLWSFTTKATDHKWPDFPPRLAMGAFTAAAVAVIAAFEPTAAHFWLGLTATGALLLLTILWTSQARGLDDLALPALLGFAVFAVIYAPEFASIVWDVAPQGEDVAQNAVIRPIFALLGVGLATSAVIGWRSLSRSGLPVAHTYAAVTTAPVIAVIIDLFWSPVPALGKPLWAVCLVVIAALMTVLATRYKKADTGTLRTSLAAMAAIVMITFALVALFTKAALTIAIAAAIAATSFLARSQSLPLLGHLASLGALILIYRLTFDPGINWAVDHDNFWEVALAYIASGVLVVLGLRAISNQTTSAPFALESTAWSIAGIFASAVITRWFDNSSSSDATLYSGLIAIVWLILAFAQFYRARGAGWPDRAFRILGWVYMFFAIIPLIILLTLANPLFEFFKNMHPGILLTCYGVPALLLCLMAYKLTHMNKWVLRTFGATGIFLALLTIGLLIRFAWRGPNMELPGLEAGELYSYTIAMMILSGGLLFAALVRKEAPLRRAALLALGLTSAKVFLIDVSGLTGLLRVVAFLALGLSLAGLAWLDRRFGDSGALTPEGGPATPTTGDDHDKENAG